MVWQVSFKDHVLSIVAERKEEKTEDDDTKHYSDFSYGKIVRHLRVRYIGHKRGSLRGLILVNIINLPYTY
jgi:hypothetical protein